MPFNGMCLWNVFVQTFCTHLFDINLWYTRTMRAIPHERINLERRCFDPCPNFVNGNVCCWCRCCCGTHFSCRTFSMKIYMKFTVCLFVSMPYHATHIQAASRSAWIRFHPERNIFTILCTTDTLSHMHTSAATNLHYSKFTEKSILKSGSLFHSTQKHIKRPKSV